MKKLLSIIVIISLNYLTVKSQTWTLNQHRDDIEFSDIKFMNANEGFAFGDSSIGGAFITAAILKTTDGGQTWATYVLGNPNYQITKSFFLNATEGFAAGRNGGGNNGLFLKTNDGGVTWTNPATFTERLFNVCFINSTIGWVMGKNGLLSKTIDGGITWNNQGTYNEDIFSMRFFNSTQGVMVCGGGEIYVTTDAGANWNLVASNVSEDLIAVSTNNTSAWICGTGGTLLYSTDAGQTWASQASASTVDFSDISFPDASNGYAAGIVGTINQTQSAGTLWQSQMSNCVEDIIALAVPDLNHGWFCTPNGDLYSFVNSTVSVATTAGVASISIYPNPLIHASSLELNLTESKNISISIVDVTGREIKTIPSKHFPLGKNLISIDLAELNSGIYYCKIKSDSQLQTVKLIKN